MIRLCVLWLCLVAAASATKLGITDFAVPSAVKVGENAELQCRYQGPPETALFYIKWWWTPLHRGKDERKVIYLRLSKHEAQATHLMNITIKANDSIEITNLQPKNSGIFECEVFDEGEGLEEDHKQQAMIVYAGTQPDLNITEVPDGPDADTEDDVIIECQADGVAPEPDLVIDINGEQQEKLNTIIVKNNVTGKYDIYTNITVSKDDVIDKEVRCELFFKNDDVAHEAYVNAETYHEEGAELVSTESPEVDDSENATTEPLQNDDNNHSSMTEGSLVLLTALLITHLFVTP